MNPYLVLSLSRDAMDADVRRAYLEGIKVATPETHPARFKSLTVAYDQIKDETSRLRYELFNLECPGESPLEVALRHLRVGSRPKPLDFEALKAFLRAGAKP